MSTLKDLSSAMADAVEKGAAYTVTVDDGRGYPASGVIYKPELVVTAAQSVEDEERIRVVLADGTEVAASLAGKDPSHDLALLRVEKAVGPVAEAAGGNPRVGELALALGRPTDDGVQASLGVIGIVDGNYQGWHGGGVTGVMRTDATRFPGFAGGPLINGEGLLLGINTFGFQYGSSLTIPVAEAWRVADKLESEGTVKPGYLGVRSQPVEVPEGIELGRSQESGLLVVGIEKGSPAGSSTLLVGDILVGLDGQSVPDHQTLLGRLSDGIVGREVTAQVIRAGQMVDVAITIGEAPSDGGGRHHHGPHGRHHGGGHHGPGHHHGHGESRRRWWGGWVPALSGTPRAW